MLENAHPTHSVLLELRCRRPKGHQTQCICSSAAAGPFQDIFGTQSTNICAILFSVEQKGRLR